MNVYLQRTQIDWGRVVDCRLFLSCVYTFSPTKSNQWGRLAKQIAINKLLIFKGSYCFWTLILDRFQGWIFNDFIILIFQAVLGISRH